MSFSKKEKLFAALILYVCGLKLNQVAKYIGNFKSVSHFADLKIVLTLSLTNISSCCLSCLISEMKGKEIDTVASQAVCIVTATLQLVLLLEDWRPSCLRHVSMTSRIARIMCVFLTGKKKGQPANADVLPVVFVFFFFAFSCAAQYGPFKSSFIEISPRYFVILPRYPCDKSFISFPYNPECFNSEKKESKISTKVKR